MNVLITPNKLSGTVLIPPSKSESHRAIIAASLAKGKSIINNIVYSEDVLATIGAMEKIGVKFIKNANQLIVNGVARINFTDDNFIDCNESGSTLRFVLPVLSLSKQKVVFTGKPNLFRRPMSVFEAIFRQCELSFVQTDKNIIMSGALTPGYYELPGNISSQFISGLLFALPLLKGDSVVKVTTVLESEEYVTMTVAILKHYGINIIVEDHNLFHIPGNQVYQPANFCIEGDFSQMAVFATAGFLNGNITCKNIHHDENQPDRRILEYGKRMGGNYEVIENGYAFHRSEMTGEVLDIGQCPDLGPILALLGALSNGTTVIDNAARLKFKESNRLQSTYDTLKAMGVNVELTDSSLIIQGRSTLEGGTFETFNDHRIAMMIAIASSHCNKPVLIKNAEVVNKSYPEFFADFARVGGNFTIIEG